MSESEIIPHAKGPEKSVLSWLLKNPERFFPLALAEGVGPDHFWAHRSLAEAMFERFRAGETLELVAFCEEESYKGRLETMGGASTITDVYTYGVASGDHWQKHLDIVKDRFAVRLALEGAQRLSETLDASEAKEAAEDTLRRLTEAVSGPKRASTGKEAVQSFLKHFNELYTRGELPGRPTGIPQLDLVSGGMREGELWVIAGRPSRGKSVLMLQITAHILKEGLSAAVFSLEMMTSKVVGRLASCMGRIRYDAITKPKTGKPIERAELQKLQRAAGEIMESGLHIDDTAGLTIDRIVAEAQRIRDINGKLDLVVVDYLQLVSGDRRRNESRQEEIARVSSALKQLSKELSCPVLTASQLNDDGKVRESRAIEQDADALLFIVDDGVKVGKLRDGQRDDVLPLVLNGEMQRFEHQ